MVYSRGIGKKWTLSSGGGGTVPKPIESEFVRAPKRTLVEAGKRKGRKLIGKRKVQKKKKSSSGGKGGDPKFHSTLTTLLKVRSGHTDKNKSQKRTHPGSRPPTEELKKNKRGEEEREDSSVRDLKKGKGNKINPD